MSYVVAVCAASRNVPLKVARPSPMPLQMQYERCISALKKYNSDVSVEVDQASATLERFVTDLEAATTFQGLCDVTNGLLSDIGSIQNSTTVGELGEVLYGEVMAAYKRVALLTAPSFLTLTDTLFDQLMAGIKKTDTLYGRVSGVGMPSHNQWPKQMLRVRQGHAAMLRVVVDVFGRDSPEEAMVLGAYEHTRVYLEESGAVEDPWVCMGMYETRQWDQQTVYDDVTEQYETKVARVESLLLDCFKGRFYSLEAEESVYDLFRAFETVLRRPSISVAVAEYRKPAIERLGHDLWVLKRSIDDYSSDSDFQANVGVTLPHITSHIAVALWYTMYCNRVTKIVSRVAAVLGTDWKKSTAAKGIKDNLAIPEGMERSFHPGRMLKEWETRCQRVLSEWTGPDNAPGVQDQYVLVMPTKDHREITLSPAVVHDMRLVDDFRVVYSYFMAVLPKFDVALVDFRVPQLENAKKVTSTFLHLGKYITVIREALARYHDVRARFIRPSSDKMSIAQPGYISGSSELSALLLGSLKTVHHAMRPPSDSGALGLTSVTWVMLLNRDFKSLEVVKNLAVACESLYDLFLDLLDIAEEAETLIASLATCPFGSIRSVLSSLSDIVLRTSPKAGGRFEEGASARFAKMLDGLCVSVLQARLCHALGVVHASLGGEDTLSPSGSSTALDTVTVQPQDTESVYISGAVASACEADAPLFRPTPCPVVLSIEGSSVAVSPSIPSLEGHLLASVNSVIYMFTSLSLPSGASASGAEGVPGVASGAEAVAQATKCYTAVSTVVSHAVGQQRTWDSCLGALAIKHEVVFMLLGDDLRKWDRAMLELASERQNLLAPSSVGAASASASDLAPVDCTQLRRDVLVRYDTWYGQFFAEFCKRVCLFSDSLLEECEEVSTVSAGVTLEGHGLDSQAFIESSAEIVSARDRYLALKEQVARLDRSEEILGKIRCSLPKDWSGPNVRKAFSRLQHTVPAMFEDLVSKVPQLRDALCECDKALASVVSNTLDEWSDSRPSAVSVSPGKALSQCATAAGTFSELKQRVATLGPLFAATSALSRTYSETHLQTEDGVEYLSPLRSEVTDKGCDATLSAALIEVSDLTQVWTCLRTGYDNIEEIGRVLWRNLDNSVVLGKLRATRAELVDLPAGIRSYACFGAALDVLDGLISLSPTIDQLASEALKPRHWRSLSHQLKTPLEPQGRLSLEQVWTALGKRRGSEQEIASQAVLTVATGELGLERYLDQIEDQWSQYTLELVKAASTRGRCLLITGWKDLQALLDEHLLSINSMVNSPYYGQFAERASQWNEWLTGAATLIEEWAQVQRLWVHLQSVFEAFTASTKRGGGVAVHLSGVITKLRQADAEFISVMEQAKQGPVLFDLVARHNAAPKRPLQARLERVSDTLTQVQRSLGEFLEAQRQKFPRLYFVGDTDVLDIISIGAAPSLLQRHWAKMFGGLSSVDVEFTGEDTGKGQDALITAFVSHEGERVLYKHPIAVPAGSDFHDMLNAVERETSETLRLLTIECIAETKAVLETCFGAKAETEGAVDPADQMLALLPKYPVQSLIVALQVYFTALTESELAAKTTPERSIEEASRLLTVLGGLAGHRALSGHQNRDSSRRTCINEVLHFRVIASDLRAKGICDKGAYEWLSQMRFYYDSDAIPEYNEAATVDVSKSVPGDVRVAMSDASFKYGWEYVGAGPRIVQTRLSDLCYLNLTQALHSRFGGSPFGPAGTGKTETVKALGTQLGRMCIVFNTDETFSEAVMARIFAGLCQCGHFGCFDEFNRLDEHILSAVSQQILSIQSALLSGDRNISLSGRTVKVSPNIGIFITMNPGYAGRNELPDNLKALFRSVAMASADRQRISEVLLLSHGFRHADVLAGRIVPLFSLCQQQLSKQTHYDWGFRVLKTVLDAAGCRMRESRAECDSDSEGEEEVDSLTQEQDILASVILSNISPTLVSADQPLFRQILTDALHGVSPKMQHSEAFTEVVKQVCEDASLLPHKPWLEKVLLTLTATDSRQGTMLVGVSGSGKTAALRTLAAALERHEQRPVHVHCIAPKSMSKDDLFGSLDSMTREWRDGVFTSVLRKLLEDETVSKDRHYIVFDGDLSTDWVENLNSVLDDNRTLTLPSGERLAVPSNVKLIFEVLSLKYATPATVSRCSKVWFTDTDLPSDVYLRGVTKRLASAPLNEPERWGAFSLPRKESAGLGGIGSELTVSMKVQQMAGDILTPLLSPLYDAVYKGFVASGLSTAEVMSHASQRTSRSVVSLLFAGIRKLISKAEAANTVGGAMVVSAEAAVQSLGTDHINTFILQRLLFSLFWGFGLPLTHERRADLADIITGVVAEHPAVTVALPPFPLSDGFPDAGLADWRSWAELVPATSVNESEVGLVVIPTIDTVAHQHVIGSYLENGETILLCGPPGSGKSMSLTATLKNLPGYEAVFLNFSSHTDPALIRQTIRRHCQIKHTPSGHEAVPAGAGVEHLVLMCDEINLPGPDAFGTQRVIAFLRSLMVHGGYWDTETLQFVRLRNVHIIGACNPPTDAGRYHLSPSFLRHSGVLLVNFPSEPSMLTIYSAFNDAVLRRFRSLSDHVSATTAAMVDVYSKARAEYTPDKQAHYIYSPRELTRWVRALHIGLQAATEPSLDLLVKLVVHEGMRLFHDRLVTQPERALTIQLIQSVVELHFPQVDRSCFSAGSLLFNFIGAETYRETSVNELRSLLRRRMSVYVEEEGATPLVLFDDVIQHVSRIDRVLKQPVGHLLLAGGSGVGKTVLAKFVAWLNGYETVSISTYRGYTLAQFEEELRAAMSRAGAKGRSIAFLFDESNALETAFIEHMNALLAGGEVPGLFDGESLAQVIGECRQEARRLSSVQGQTGRGMDAERMAVPSQQATDEEVWSWFVSRVQANLHVVFSINPSAGGASASMGSHASRSPALFNRCVVDWMGGWSVGSLYQVTDHMLDAIDISCAQDAETDPTYNDECKDELLDALADPLLPIDAKQEALVATTGGLSLRERVTRACVRLHLVTADTASSVTKLSAAVVSQAAASGPDFTTTPRHLVSFVDTLSRNLGNKAAHVAETLAHLSRGVSALETTSGTVAAMRSDLREKQVELQEASELADQKLGVMVDKRRDAQERRNQAETLAKSLTERQEQIEERKAFAVDKLAEVEPAVQEAKKSVRSISAQHLNELRNMARPPPAVQCAIEAVCIMIGEWKKGGLEWSEVRKVLRKDSFMPSILNFNADAIRPNIVRLLNNKYVPNPIWDPAVAYRASHAAGPMVKWVKSQLLYGEIIVQVAPLRKEVEELEAEAATMQAQYDAVASELKAVDEEIEVYSLEYKDLVRRQEHVKHTIEETQAKLDRAESLTGSLSQEQERWGKQVQEVTTETTQTVGNVLTLAAYTTYALVYPTDLRVELLRRWRAVLDDFDIAFDEDMLIDEGLSTAEDRLQWLDVGLPNDSISLENAGALFSVSDDTPRVPLLIDPAGQAVAFVKRVLKDKKLVVGSPLDRDFMQKLEQALRFGLPLLVTDAEVFDPVLNPIIDPDTLARRVSLKGRSMSVEIAGRSVDYSPSFRLILTTTNVAAAFPPHIVSQTRVLNFSVTAASLSSQIFNAALFLERPSVGRDRQDTMSAERRFAVHLRSLENQLLELISTAGGKVLEDDEVSSALSTVKRDAAEAEANQAEVLHKRAELDKASSLYETLGATASGIFGLLDRLVTLDDSLVFSLPFYQVLVKRALAKRCVVLAAQSEEDEIATGGTMIGDAHSPSATTNRMNQVIHELSMDVLMYVGAALPARLRAAFALLVLYTVNTDTVDISDDALRQYLTPLPALPSLSGDVGDILAWREAVVALSPELSVLPSDDSLLPTLESVCMGEDVHAEVQDLLTSAARPTPIQASLLSLQLVHSVRPSAVTTLANSVIHRLSDGQDVLGTIDAMSLGDICDVYGAQGWPVVALSAPGYDPTHSVVELAQAQSAKLDVYSIGSRDCVTASLVKQIGQAAQAGRWVLVSNLHLASADTLTSLLQVAKRTRNSRGPGEAVATPSGRGRGRGMAGKGDRTHDRFRLFFSAPVGSSLPASLYAESARVVVEPPPGLQSQVLQAVGRVFPGTQPERDRHRRPAQTQRDRLLFLLCVLHGVLVRRAGYLPHGWTKDPQFSMADLLAGERMVNAWLDRVAGKSDNIMPSKIPWVPIRSHLVTTIYGGRLESDYDKRTLRALVGQIFTAEAFETGYVLLGSAEAPVQTEGVEVVEAVETDTPTKDASYTVHGLLTPDGTTLADFTKWVNALPPIEPLSWLGMCPGVSDIAEARQGDALVRSFGAVCGNAALTVMDLGMSSEDVSGELSVVGAWEEVLEGCAVPEAEADAEGEGASSAPIAVTIRSEQAFARLLHSTLSAHLYDLRQFLVGECPRTNLISELLAALSAQTIPQVWADLVPYSVDGMTTSEFVSDAVRRIEQTVSLDTLCIPEAEGKGLWLGGMFFPGAYLMALKRRVCQELKRPLESLDLALVPGAPEAGAATQGVSLVGTCVVGGVSLASGVLSPSDSVDEQAQVCLVVQEVGAESDSEASEDEVPTLSMPVYLGEDRETVLFSVSLPVAKGEKETLVVRGCAVVL
ncbi:dynein heavy chain [Kipferlia bialata]|uniref:Dynein heavy chain n=1 Tax=Kipferlia bialata TaxID=797122 RepID=A0A9K3CP51_9EUKA|nr:dynein heavy chain [Kipferlia bialata]|eukprot:g519.t1